MDRMDARWRESEGAYSPVSTSANATLLTVHATAALLGHEGESRNDLRAVSLVNQLVATPAPWRGVNFARNADKMFHRPGWTQSLRDGRAYQDKAIDPKVAEALALAHRAGDTLGLDQVRAKTPPPLYAFDPDDGRVAITTPAYSTAVLPRNHRAVGYGGLEPARLMDGRGNVAATLGGDTPSSFGLRVRTAAGGTLVDSQSGETEKPGERPRIEIVRREGRSRRRITQSAARYPRYPYAGKFDALETSGTVRRSGVEIRTRHVFLPESIELAWTIVARGERARRWEACFPSWGGDAEVLVKPRGEDAPWALGRGDRIDLADAAWFVVRNEQSGYVVRPRAR
jgi:hypothetical protein